MGALLGSLSALCIGVSDLFGRRVTRASAPVTAAGVMQGVAALSSLGAVMVVSSELIWRDIALGAVSGLGMGIGLACYYGGLNRASSAVVAPVVATLSAVIPFAYTVVTGAEPTVLALTGAGVALVGLLLITAGDRISGRVMTGLRWGLCSGLGYGWGLTVVIEASSESGSWPAVPQRAVAFLLMVVVAAATDVPALPPRGVRTAAVIGGAFAGLTTVFYLAGVEADAPPAVVTASMFPAVSVAVGWLVYRDVVTRVQLLGIGGVLVGVAGVVAG